MGGFLVAIFFLAVLLAGCSRQEVIGEWRCTKIVGEKSYKQSFLGIPFIRRARKCLNIRVAGHLPCLPPYRC